MNNCPLALIVGLPLMSVCLSVCLVADVASEHRQAALQSVVVLLPDENRQALHCLLLFLNRLADYAAENQVQSPTSSPHNPYIIHSLPIARGELTINLLCQMVK